MSSSFAYFFFICETASSSFLKCTVPYNFPFLLVYFILINNFNMIINLFLIGFQLYIHKLSRLALCRVEKLIQWYTRQFILIVMQDTNVGKAQGKKISSYSPCLTFCGCAQFRASNVINSFGNSFSALSSITVGHWCGSFRTGSQGHWVVFSQGKFTDIS